MWMIWETNQIHRELGFSSVQNPRDKEVWKMNEMLAYSIHLGNDKNKTKKAKEIAKNN